MNSYLRETYLDRSSDPDLAHLTRSELTEPTFIRVEDNKLADLDVLRDSTVLDNLEVPSKAANGMGIDKEISSEMVLHLREVQANELKDDALQELSTTLQSTESRSVFIAINEDENQDELLDTVLDNRYKIEKLLRHDNHAAVYSVKDLMMVEVPLEARAYILSGVSKDLLRYRRRNMKRLASRVVRKVEYKGRNIIVYQTGQSEVENKELIASTRSPAPLAVPLTSNFLESDELNTKKPERSDHQQKVAREKQRARRGKKREERSRPLEIDTASESQKRNDEKDKGRKKPTPDERNLKFLLALYRLSKVSGTAEQITEVEPTNADNFDKEAADLLRKFSFDNSTNLLGFHDPHKLKVAVSLIKKEASFIDKQCQNLPRLLQKKKLEFSRLLKQLTKFNKSSWDWKERKREIDSVLNQVQILTELETILTETQKAVHARCEQWAKHESLIKNLDEEVNKVYTKAQLSYELQDLKEGKNLVMPYSTLYNRMEARIGVIQKDLGSVNVRELEAAYDAASDAYWDALHNPVDYYSKLKERKNAYC